LERQDPAIPIDYLYLLNKWNGWIASFPPYCFPS
jgi:hypothetical protein